MLHETHTRRAATTVHCRNCVPQLCAVTVHYRKCAHLHTCCYTHCTGIALRKCTRIAVHPSCMLFCIPSCMPHASPLCIPFMHPLCASPLCMPLMHCNLPGRRARGVAVRPHLGRGKGPGAAPAQQPFCSSLLQKPAKQLSHAVAIVYSSVCCAGERKGRAEEEEEKEQSRGREMAEGREVSCQRLAPQRP